ncbi:MAG TPA: glycosyltransferase family 39 protein [Polyangiaceae bacterium]
MKARGGIDAALGLLAAAFAAPSLTYPLSRDQALYWYVGREWLGGAVPYRDMVEHKTPLVYAVYAACAALTGETMWGIRAAEIAGTMALGWLAARLARSPGEAARPGALGASLLVASVFYYGYFPFQDQAHSELWCALLVAASVVVARDARRADVAALGGGALLGAAFLAKPPALAFAPLFALALRARPGGGGAVRTALFVAMGFVALVAAVAGYFGTHGAFGALVDVVVRANGAFALEGRKASTLGEWLWRLWKALDWFTPWSWLFLFSCAAGVVLGVRRHDVALARRYARPLAWAACAYLAVFVQLKFFVYQHALFILPCSLLGATLGADTARLRRPRLAAAGLAAAVVVSCVAMTPPDVWWLRARNALRFAAGRLSSEELVCSFDNADWIDLTHAQAMGYWVRDHAAPGDRLLVRGYEPEIYYFAGHRYGGRFFWSSVLVAPGLAYRRDAWLAEDAADIERLRPAWVVTFETPPTGAERESPGWFEAQGWKRQATIGPFVALHRDPISASTGR